MLAKPEDHGDKLIFAWFSNPFVIEKNEELVFKIIIITSLDIDHGNCWTWIHKYIHIFQMHNTQEKKWLFRSNNFLIQSNKLVNFSRMSKRNSENWRMHVICAYMYCLPTTLYSRVNCCVSVIHIEKRIVRLKLW